MGSKTKSSAGLPRFEFIRLTNSKRTVDISPNTLREYFKQGLNFYKVNKAVFVSTTELAEFIKANSQPRN